MRDMLDPVSRQLFDSVSIVRRQENGTVERVPKTEEDWEKIRIGAVTLAEGAYLLKVPRPFAPPGDLNNSTGPDAVELSPDQITAKLNRRSGRVERQNRGTAKRWSRGARHREAERRERAMGRGRESRSSV